MQRDSAVDETIQSADGAREKGTSQKSLRSDLAQEIISRKPDFMEQWALPLFGIILLLLLGSTWFIKYPDIIETGATLTAINAPKEIIVRQEGRLVGLFVHNDETVRENQVIGWIESTASHKDVIELHRQLDSGTKNLARGEIEKVSDLFKKRYGQLGELQVDYQQFITAWQLFNDYMSNGFYKKKKEMLKQDVFSLHQMHTTVDKQKDLMGQDVQLAEETFKMNDILLNEKVISRDEYRAEKSKFLNKQYSLPQLEASIITNETQQRDKQKEIFQLDHDMAQQKVIFEQALQTFKSSVEDWIHHYILSSPIGGKIVFTLPLQENRFLQQGRLIGYVMPDDAKYYAEVSLPQNNFGKIDTGLSVQLRFDAYPYQEFGFVKGRLDYISKVPSDSGFFATVQLDRGLVTNYYKSLQYRSGLKARAIVITRNLRLMQRIYYNIIKSTSVNK